MITQTRSIWVVSGNLTVLGLYLDTRLYKDLRGFHTQLGSHVPVEGAGAAALIKKRYDTMTDCCASE